jgi:hypothetical protein
MLLHSYYRVIICFSLACCPEASICNIFHVVQAVTEEGSGSDSGSWALVISSHSTPILLVWLHVGEWLVLEPSNALGKCNCVTEM